ncbi:M28 family peptidase [bacterium]|nr:M28 family peptidase [candidate division CSSED10-310 bacterium]
MNNQEKQNEQTGLRIEATQLMNHIRALSSPAMRGRMPGDSGYELASVYVEKILAGLGIEPMGDSKTYRQVFPLEVNRVRSARVTFHAPDGGSIPLELGRDFICRGLTGSGSIHGPLVFTGYSGESDPVDELSGIDLHGKIAVTFKHPPPWAGNRHGDLPREKAHRLKKRGAVGLAIIPNPNLEKPDRMSASLMESMDPLPDFPMIVLSEEIATRMMDFGEQTLSSRQYQIDIHRRSATQIIPGGMSVEIETDLERNGRCWNVIGCLKGRDPECMENAVVLGAHMDHVGIQGESLVFPGAQDNASGVSGVLEIARVMSMSKRPAYSVVFILFGAEETGIVGSRFYGEHPAWPMHRTLAMLNLDCMGAGIGLDTRGRKSHPALFDIFDRMNDRYVKISDTMADHPAGGADAEAFERAGVPNMFIVADNPYRHLHMISDTAETLNPSVFRAITQLVCLTALSLNGSR